ncbi:MAG: GDP-mannose 4,6-dehydratase, partial [Clostridiales bacterium]
YFNPIGAHKSGKIGENPKDIPNNLMPYISKVAVGELEELRIFGDDYPTADGTGVRDFIHVVDLAKAHIAALEYINKNKGVNVFNIGTGIGYSVLDLVHTFEKVNGIKLPYCITSRRDGDAASCFANVEKAKSVLGWEAKETIENMCEDSWHWQKYHSLQKK